MKEGAGNPVYLHATSAFDPWAAALAWSRGSVLFVRRATEEMGGSVRIGLCVGGLRSTAPERQETGCQALSFNDSHLGWHGENYNIAPVQEEPITTAVAFESRTLGGKSASLWMIQLA